MTVPVRPMPPALTVCLAMASIMKLRQVPSASPPPNGPSVDRPWNIGLSISDRKEASKSSAVFLIWARRASLMSSSNRPRSAQWARGQEAGGGGDGGEVAHAHITSISACRAPADLMA
jgi:hypothetical protein